MDLQTAVKRTVEEVESLTGCPVHVEVATLGMKGFDVNDSTQKYQLRTLPGHFSGLHMVCLMYAAFKITDPTADIGFDLAAEYAMANEMRRDRRNS